MYRLHGVPLSQPVRSVAWAMLMKRTSFECRIAIPGSADKLGTRHEEHLKRSHGLGTVPVLEEVETGFTLVESPAILSYLADVHGWDDLYPKDLKQRAKVSAYMSWHHRGVRELTPLVVPHMRPDLKASATEAAQKARTASATAALEKLDGAWLGGGPYIGGFGSPTLADILCYSEVGQMLPQHLDLFDVSPFPNVVAWTARMAKLPGYDAVHASLVELGSLSRTNETPMPKRLAAATKVGLKAIGLAAQGGKL